MCFSATVNYNLIALYWRLIFITEICISIVIIILLYLDDAMIYFWVSFALFAVYYLIGLGLISFAWCMITRDRWRTPLISYCLPCFMASDILCHTECIEESMEFCDGKVFWWCCILCSLPPFIVWMLFTPIYITIAMIFASKRDIQDGLPQLGLACYLLPQNILNLIILLNYNTNNMTLYSLLIVSIFVTLFWYFSACYLWIINTSYSYSSEKVMDGLTWTVEKMSLLAGIIDVIWILTAIIIYAYIGGMLVDEYLWLNILAIICVVISMPCSLSVIMKLYEDNTALTDYYNHRYVVFFRVLLVVF